MKIKIHEVYAINSWINYLILQCSFRLSKLSANLTLHNLGGRIRPSCWKFQFHFKIFFWALRLWACRRQQPHLGFVKSKKKKYRSCKVRNLLHFIPINFRPEGNYYDHWGLHVFLATIVHQSSPNFTLMCACVRKKKLGIFRSKVTWEQVKVKKSELLSVQATLTHRVPLSCPSSFIRCQKYVTNFPFDTPAKVTLPYMCHTTGNTHQLTLARRRVYALLVRTRSVKCVINPFSPSGHCIGQPSKISILF